MITRTASEIAEICGATVEGDGSVELVGPAPLEEARGDQVSFLGNPMYRSELESTRAGAVLLAHGVEVERRDVALLRCENPNTSFSRVIEEFLAPEARPAPGVHASAFVDPTAELGAEVSVGPNATVCAGARIGARTIVHGNVFVGPNAEIGEDGELHPAVVLGAGVQVGRRCRIHAGTVIGSDGFGFDPTPEGWVKIPQCGTVEIGDDVEIGANCAIDRGRFQATKIGSGAKLDNLVHLAHNVEVGEGALLIAQVGISGSSRVGKQAILAGQVGVAGHLKIGDGARVGAQSGIGNDLPPGTEWFGSPATPKMLSIRSSAALKRLPDLLKEFKALQKRVEELEERG